MARRRLIREGELAALTHRQAAFVVEYMKDFNILRSADAMSLHPNTARDWLELPVVQQVVEAIIYRRQQESDIDAEWVLYELVDNHRLARAQGNITASNTALGLISKHRRVDAFAALQVEVSTDSAVMERLQRGRKRLSGHTVDGEAVAIDEPAPEGVSFL